MAQAEPVADGREAPVDCQHCYSKIYRVRGTIDWWISDDGTESRICDPLALDMKHTPMPEIRVP